MTNTEPKQVELLTSPAKSKPIAADPAADAVEPESEEPKTEESITEDPSSLIERGKVAARQKDYSNSTELLSMAVEALAIKFGDDAVETAEAFFLYGESLLNKTIQTTALLSGEATVKEAMMEKLQEVALQSEKEPPTSKFVFHDEQEEEEEEEEVQEDDGEDVDNEEISAEEECIEDMQLAWEVLENARRIYENANVDENYTLELADVYASLGTVSMESEMWDQAIQDLNKSLSLKLTKLPSSDRLLAEAYYDLALVYEYSHLPDESIAHLKSAVKVLVERIGCIKDDVDEIKEIEGLIEEIHVKIGELKIKVEVAPVVEETIDATSVEAKGKVVVNDVSALVKPKMVGGDKRKDVDDEKDEGSAAKKVKEAE
jgi:tetratricopeptide (TPR) repeat protein